MLMRAQVQFEAPPLPVLPDFITQHLDPFSGDDDSADIDAATGAVHVADPVAAAQHSRSRSCRRARPRPRSQEAPVSRNAPCPCGSGLKYKHCHGRIA